MKTNKRIAFKPHKTRGKEIIKILEGFGASNIRGLEATWRSEESDKLAYYVTDYRTIGYNPLYLVKQLGYEIYTLEEYESMNNRKKDQELLLGLVPVKDKGQELIPHKDYEIKQDGDKFYLVKKKKEYSKTYEECCRVLDIIDNRPIWHGYRSVQLKIFQKLLICRDAYWKIAGEEMGLGEPWKPDWCDYTTKYCIIYSPQYRGICKRQYDGIKQILAFPTEEMQCAFYDNFKELIEVCKELL